METIFPQNFEATFHVFFPPALLLRSPTHSNPQPFICDLFFLFSVEKIPPSLQYFFPLIDGPSPHFLLLIDKWNVPVGFIFIHWTWHLLDISNLETHILQFLGKFSVLFILWFSPFHFPFFFNFLFLELLLALSNSSLIFLSFFFCFLFCMFSRFLLNSRLFTLFFQSFYWVFHFYLCILHFKIVFQCSFLGLSMLLVVFSW